jgi:hypothetical protein
LCRSALTYGPWGPHYVSRRIGPGRRTAQRCAVFLAVISVNVDAIATVDVCVERLGRDSERDETTCHQMTRFERRKQMTMRACGVDRAKGAVSVLELAEPPDPGHGEVLITVQPAGMGPWDALLYTGGWGGLRLMRKCI